MTNKQKNLLKKCFEYKGQNRIPVYKMIARNASINIVEAKKLFNIKSMNSSEKVLYIELDKKYILG